MSTIKITESIFGVINNENEIKKYTLSTDDGFTVCLINYGATIQSIRQADKKNNIEDITLGFDNLQDYVESSSFFGVTVGRVASRIKNAQFQLDGITYQLEKTDGTKKHYLHGGFHKRIWDSSIENQDTVVFKYQSPDGEDRFPGQVDVTVKYQLSNDHKLKISFHATTNKATPINLTNHAYFNLAGDSHGSILDHKFQVSAEKYTPLDDELIPTGEIASVEKTLFDFRNMTTIGQRINDSFDGYDMMFVIDGDGNRPFAKLIHEQSGRVLTVESTQKGLQFYTGNFLDGIKGHNGATYNKHGGLCLETQNFTDGVNNQAFPNTILRPGEIYYEETTYHFHLL